MANLDLLRKSREMAKSGVTGRKAMKQGKRLQFASAKNPVVSNTAFSPTKAREALKASEQRGAFDITKATPSTQNLARQDIQRRENVTGGTEPSTYQAPTNPFTPKSDFDSQQSRAYFANLRDQGISQQELMDVTGTDNALEAQAIARGLTGLDPAQQALVDENLARLAGQKEKDRIEKELMTEEERIRQDVKDRFAPEFTKAREAGERTRETALRVQGRAAMGSKSEEEQQLINEKQQEVERSIAAQQRLEESRMLAQARGASSEEMEAINAQIQAAKDKRMDIQEELALQQAGLDQAAIERSEFNTEMMLDALEAGFEYDPASNSFTKMDEAMGPQKIDQGISKMLGYASDQFGNPITGADGNPLQITKDNDIQWGTYTDKYGNPVFYDKSNPTNILNPGAVQTYQTSSGDLSSSQTSDVSGVQVLGQGEPYTRDDGGQGFLGENCVKFARENVPNLPFGLFNKQDKQQAIQMAAKEGFGGLGGMEAQVGDAILTGEGSVGHAAVVIGRDDATGELILGEANYSPGQVTTGRRIAANDPSIYGYISSSKQPQMSSVINPSATNEGLNPGIASQVVASSGQLPQRDFSRIEEKRFEFYENNDFELPKNIDNYADEVQFLNDYAQWSAQQETLGTSEIDKRTQKFIDKGFSKAEARERAIEELDNIKKSSIQAQANSRAITAIDNILSDVESGLGASALGRSWGSVIPGSKPADISSALDTVEGAIAFDTLAKMRAASKTGGALGAISEKELALLSSQGGAIKAGQSTDRLKENLKTIKASLMNFNNAVKYDEGRIPKQINGFDTMIDENEMLEQAEEKGYDPIDYKIALLQAGFVIK